MSHKDETTKAQISDVKRRVEKITSFNPFYYEEHLEQELQDLRNTSDKFVASEIDYDEMNGILKLWEDKLPINPCTLSKKEFLQLSRQEQDAYALKCAQYYVSFVTPYNYATTRVERQSEHINDWYMYSVVAQSYKNKKNNTWAVWSMNLSTGGMCYGHYDLDVLKINKYLNEKRS